MNRIGWINRTMKTSAIIFLCIIGGLALWAISYKIYECYVGRFGPCCAAYFQRKKMEKYRKQLSVPSPPPTVSGTNHSRNQIVPSQKKEELTKQRPGAPVRVDVGTDVSIEMPQRVTTAWGPVSQSGPRTMFPPFTVSDI